MNLNEPELEASIDHLLLRRIQSDAYKKWHQPQTSDAAQEGATKVQATPKPKESLPTDKPKTPSVTQEDLLALTQQASAITKAASAFACHRPTSGTGRSPVFHDILDDSSWLDEDDESSHPTRDRKSSRKASSSRHHHTNPSTSNGNKKKGSTTETRHEPKRSSKQPSQETGVGSSSHHSTAISSSHHHRRRHRTHRIRKTGSQAHSTERPKRRGHQ